MILNGKTVNPGKTEGEALVSQMPFSFVGDLDVQSGKIVMAGHDLKGESAIGKILVFSTGHGSTGGPTAAYQAKKLGNIPAGMICIEAEPVIAVGAILNDIPMVHRLDKDPLEVIKTGDYIKMDAAQGIVEVIRRS